MAFKQTFSFAGQINILAVWQTQVFSNQTLSLPLSQHSSLSLSLRDQKEFVQKRG